MWATAPLPYYSAYKPSRRNEGASAGNKDSSPPPSSINSRQQQAPLPLLSTQQRPDHVADSFEPALDGPPSPERIRALSKQMKRASAVDKHRSHTTTSSGSSSSLRSLNSDRSWEHTLETITLSRRSSGRSTSSSMQPRDRPESVQLFGKSIFNRRAKMKRESSSNQSSSGNSSLYSGELALDGPTSTAKDHFIPSIFGRRRTLRQDDLGDDPALGRKLQISGPYNFQHVTHTKRDHLPDLQRGSRAELVTEFSAIRAGQRPTTGQPRGIDVEDLHFANFSSEALHTQQEIAPTSEPRAELLNRPPAITRHTGPPPAPRRLVKHTRSQEQLRSSPPRPAPPRPPRLPIHEEPMSPTLPGSPVPPPRSSSRIARHFTASQDSIATTDSNPEHPQTSSFFQHPGGPCEAVAEAIEPLATAQGTPSSGEGLEVLVDPRFSHAITTPDDAAWPLTASTGFSCEMALPDVPEEEEQYVLSGKSRGSLISTRSSLRGSQSVPVLRQLAQTQDEPERPPSGASDTLGSFDMFAAQNALREVLEVDDVAEASHRASWEDDIDYCYEHEAEANCDYAWERPSLDLVRESFAQASLDTDSLFVAPLSAGLKPASSDPADHMPALSPASQTSLNGHEAITPTITTLPVRSNFSHPRKETNYRGNTHLHVRTASQASSFKESHGFHLSPSLLIPGDFRQQMLADSDTDAYPVNIARQNSGHFSFDEEPVLTIEPPGLFVRDRASTSTTGSNSSSQTSSTGARHASTNSTWTTLTRYTGSTTFEGWNPKVEGSEHSRSFSVDDLSELALGSPRGQKSTMAPLPESEVLTMSRSTGDIRVASARLDASQSQEHLPLSKTREPARLHQRQRAQTLSAPPPPGQYALFPPIYSGNRI